jgi:hypothetical protein
MIYRHVRQRLPCWVEIAGRTLGGVPWRLPTTPHRREGRMAEGGPGRTALAMAAWSRGVPGLGAPGLDHPDGHPDDPTGPFWIRLDRRGSQREQGSPSGADQADVEHQPTDLAVGGSDPPVARGGPPRRWARGTGRRPAHGRPAAAPGHRGTRTVRSPGRPSRPTPPSRRRSR